MKTQERTDQLTCPRDPSSGEPMAARRQPGYYSGFSTLSQKSFWDDATRAVIVDRVESPPEIKFFSVQELEFWTAVFSHLIPQTDRTPDRQIDVIGP
ncbi:MAG TPA: gluconate 2-dehydrogenase subunit 3 family protein, partial [Terriglobales bacterium]|nr:gluconate 2-dehydrogenase subunit 3 family protein [Terriglobales bacterium]